MNEEGTEDMSISTKAMMRWARFENPPEFGRRRMRQLTKELARKEAEIKLLEIQQAKLQADVESRENTIRSLIMDSSYQEDRIKELEDKLDTTIHAAWTNQQRVSFAFFDQNDPRIDSSTQAIDVSELRRDLAEPLTGKVTQFNPTTGRHDTVELHMSAAASEPVPQEVPLAKVVFLGVGINGSVSPVHVPGMAAVS
jgi:hypothetical protein